MATFVEAVQSLKSAAMDALLDSPKPLRPTLNHFAQVAAIPDGSQKKSPEGQGEPSGPVESRPGEGPDFLGSTQGGE